MYVYVSFMLFSCKKIKKNHIPFIPQFSLIFHLFPEGTIPLI